MFGFPRLKTLIGDHVRRTGSQKASAILSRWDEMWPLFVKVLPNDYRRMLEAISAAEDDGLRGHSDIAAGNVVGSNLFNMLGILGVTSIVAPVSRVAVGWVDLGVMVAVAVVALPLLLTHLRLSRLEGALLLAIYVGYMSWVVVG